jgi:hypothetical protein
MNQNNNADCRICGRTIRGFDNICLSCWNGIEESEPTTLIGGAWDRKHPIGTRINNLEV